MDSEASTSTSGSGGSPLTPPRIGPSAELIKDSHATYDDQTRSSFTPSSSVPPFTSITRTMDPQPSTSSSMMQPQDTEQSATSTQLLSYLLSLSFQDRMDLDLKSVSIPDLIEASLLDPPLLENHNALFLEALYYPVKHRTFIVFPCYFCNGFNSSTPRANTIHVLEEHIGALPLDLQAMLPKQVPDWWITNDCYLSWTPLDPATLQPVTSSTERKRTELLAQIQPIFDYLTDHDILNINHISALIDLAKDTVPAIRSRPWLVEATLNLSNACIRVLGAPQLGTALRFLKALKTCRPGSVFEETQDEEMPVSSHISVFLAESEVTVQLKFGTWPDDVVRWLYDSSAEVSGSSMNNAIKSREHKIRKVVKKYLQFLVRLVRACQLKKIRLEHSNALVNLRYLGKDDLRERIRTSDGIEKIAMGEIIQEMCALEESNQENHHIQDAISKKINKLRFECLLIDARIMWVLDYLGKLRPKIGRASKLDYSIVVKPLVRYCFKKRMENLLKQITSDLSVSELEAHKNEPSNQLDDEGPSGASIVEKPTKT